MQVLVVLVGELAHVGGQRPHHAVAEQDAEEGPHQGRGHVLADLFGRSAQRAHGDDDAQHRGHNAQAGQRIGHRGQRRRRAVSAS